MPTIKILENHWKVIFGQNKLHPSKLSITKNLNSAPTYTCNSLFSSVVLIKYIN